MPIFGYETIPLRPGEAPAYFEVRQQPADPPLVRHPVTGQPVRRVGVPDPNARPAGEDGRSRTDAPDDWGISCCE